MTLIACPGCGSHTSDQLECCPRCSFLIREYQKQLRYQGAQAQILAAHHSAEVQEEMERELRWYQTKRAFTIAMIILFIIALLGHLPPH